MAAALEASRAGLSCTILDEAPRLGGQIYRQTPVGFTVQNPAALGKSFERGERFRAEFAAASDRVEVRNATSVLGIWGRDILWTSGDASGMLQADQIIIAPGARDRSVPFPGWTLPGVMTAGGAQVFLKTFGVRPGQRTLVAGTGPLLLVVANQLHMAGVEVTAVLEAGRPRFSFAALRKVWGQWSLLKDAWDYLQGLRKAGIPVLYNHTVFAAHGGSNVEAASYGPVDPKNWQPLRDHATRVPVDFLVVGFGLVPNTEVTILAGCRHEYRHEVGGWIPVRDEFMRTSVFGIFAVGDGAGVAGVLVAVDEGRVAGITAAEQAGVLAPAEANRRRANPLKRLRALARMREVVDEVSWLRPGLCNLATPETLVCRCEEVRLEAVQAAMKEGARDLQAVKLMTRLGMGACQGRNCGPSMSMYLSHTLECPPEEVGLINPRPPAKPVTFGAFARFEASTQRMEP